MAVVLCYCVSMAVKEDRAGSWQLQTSDISRYIVQFDEERGRAALITLLGDYYTRIDNCWKPGDTPARVIECYILPSPYPNPSDLRKQPS